MSSIRLKQDFTDHFVPWLKALLGGTYPVIIQQPNQTRPAVPYVGVQITSPLEMVGSSDHVAHKTGDTFELGGQRRILVTVTAYLVKNSTNMDTVDDFYLPMDLLAKLQDAVDDAIVMETLRAEGIAIWSVGDILDLTELVESGFETRAQVELVVGIASNRESGLGYIDQVEFTGIPDGSGEAPILVNE